MDAPAYAPEPVTGFVAAGSQIILFTTGVGNSYVRAVAPTLKLSANPHAVAQLRQQLDFDASTAFLGHESIEATAEQLFARMISIASGQAT